MNCQNCHKNVATVKVIEILPGGGATPGNGAAKPFQVQELCEICAQSKNLPHVAVFSPQSTMGDIWKLLQISSQQTKKRQDITCPDCGMTREEFRRKGRVGCARDYKVFAEDIREILERVHGALEHTGRIPGKFTGKVGRMKEIATLRKALDDAIREEAYENAARIRDELQQLGE